jgi:hypothetical protein
MSAISWGVEQLVCANDDAAIAVAKRLLDGRDIELWQGARKVTVLSSSRTDDN